MRVFIDARMVGSSGHGIATYVTQLARGLALIREERALGYAPIFITRGEFPTHPALAGFETCSARSHFLSPVEMLELPALLRRGSAALYHSPSFSSLPWAPCPWIVTVHDLIHLRFGGLREKIYYRTLLASFCRRARAVLTVSESSRDEIRKWIGLEARVVENALDLAPISEGQIVTALGKYGLSRGKYFLCFSNPKPHKNVARLVEAYRTYQRTRGEGAWPLVLNLSEFSDLPSVRALGHLSDSDYRGLLAGAGAFFFPSLYEGFGIPPVEAAALGVPVVVSRIPAHREGLRGLEPSEVGWVDPENLPAWTEAFGRAERGEIHGASPTARGRIRERFQTKRLGSDMDQIYRRVLGLKG